MAGRARGRRSVEIAILGGLFLSDAMAEYKDGQFVAAAGNGRSRNFESATRSSMRSPPGTLNLRRATDCYAQRPGRPGRFLTKDYKINGSPGVI